MTIPTYEEYKSATAFARFRYRFGIVFIILCWIFLLFIIYYMYTNGEALATNPLIYGAEKHGVECYCHSTTDFNAQFFVNSTSINVVE